MTDKISGSVMSMDEAIRYHLEYNISVPIPDIYLDILTPICIQAIKAVNEHDMDRLITLTNGITWTNLRTGEEMETAPAYDIVRIYGLTSWLNPEWF